MICESLKNFNNDAIIINEPIKNSAVQCNYFYKILYSTSIVSLTSIFILFELTNTSFENDKVRFDRNVVNNNVLMKLIELEEYIFNLISETKNKLYKIKEVYEKQYFKYTLCDDVDNLTNYNYLNHIDNTNKRNTFVIKISGIWESKDAIGLTFKIVIVNKFIEFI